MTTPHPPPATGQILREQLDILTRQVEALTAAVQQLQIVVRSEQEHTRRAILIERGGGLAKERAT